jgi:hypothetical protein
LASRFFFLAKISQDSKTSYETLCAGILLIASLYLHLLFVLCKSNTYRKCNRIYGQFKAIFYQQWPISSYLAI